MIEVVEAFLEQLDSDHTRRAYGSDLRDFVRTVAGDDRVDHLDQVSEQTLHRYVRSMQTRDLSEATRQRRFSALRQFFDWLIEQGQRDRNPARTGNFDLTGYDGRDTEVDEDRHLTRVEIEALVSATSDSGEAAVRDRGLVLTILYAALRRSEVAALTVDDVRPLGRHWVIDVPSEEGRMSGYVKVPESVIEAIDAVQTRYGIGSGPLWRSLSNRNRGSRLSPDAIYKIVRRTGQRAGIDDVTVEKVRQAGLRFAWADGATMKHVQEHARLASASSVDRYTDIPRQKGRLHTTAVDFLDLNVDTLRVDEE